MNDALFVINEPPRPAPKDYENTSLKTKCIAAPNAIDFPFAVVEANARLIAASPDLLEALNKALLVLKDEQRVREESYLPQPSKQEEQWLTEISEAVESAEAAIAKAKGSQ